MEPDRHIPVLVESDTESNARVDSLSVPGLHAKAWTKTAVKVSFFEPGIKIQREGWVWVGAVTPPAPDEL